MHWGGSEIKISFASLVLLLWLWPSWIVASLAWRGGAPWPTALLFGVAWPLAFVIESVKVWRKRRQ